jgi:serine protease Do
VLGAQIVAVDTETDLAVLKVEATGLPVLPFGDSEALRPGQLVLAFGSPLGLESTVTMGVVSAVARQLSPEDPMIYLQTDASINPGNSGGAVVDTEGRLVGVSTLIYSQSGGNEGIGFAAPSNIVRNVFSQIRKTGRVRRGECADDHAAAGRSAGHYQ